MDKAYHRKASRAHYQANRESYTARNKRRRREARQFILDYKRSRSCTRCGYNKCAAALDFHHPDGAEKEVSIGDVHKNGWGTKRIQAEIDKCVLLCANCHREEHFKPS